MSYILFIPIVVGWLAGVFVNYASDVLPVTRRFSQPNCRQCQSHYTWTEYLTMRACRQCGTQRSLRTWIVQLFFAASFLYFWLNPPIGLGLPLGLIVLTYFGMITVIDLEHRLILHPTSLAGAVLGLVVGTFVFSKFNGFTNGLITSVLGGIAGFGAMFVLYQLGAWVARIRARKMGMDDGEEALGGGDVYLAGVLGLMLGWPNIVLGLMCGILVGGAVSLLVLAQVLVQRRYTQGAMMTFIPYGPSLILGAVYVLYFF